MFRGLQVYYQLKLRGLLHRQIGRLSSLKDLVHEGGRAPKHVETVRPVADEAARRLQPITRRRQPPLCCEVQYLSLVGNGEGVPNGEQGLGAAPGHRVECWAELVRGSHFHE